MNAIKVFHPITIHERVNAVTFLCHVTTLYNFRISLKTTCVFVIREHILNSKPIWWSTYDISKNGAVTLAYFPLQLGGATVRRLNKGIP
ncbi:hypothetical protein CKAN_02268000 [Cinnamomum micranthum f. kanehirae]|uniref:Uncharacterized protein n=1 Tax=Cinnamomum micranthum f. kanehirae TaxID=337451 RepID=A0A3S3P4W6_9MAGN|nr:hypothetical protein CKAN_02268000 [Cinnamomum micranthum f. kanehirae]